MDGIAIAASIATLCLLHTMCNNRLNRGTSLIDNLDILSATIILAYSLI